MSAFSEAFPNSTKIHVDGPRDVRVPMREIAPGRRRAAAPRLRHERPTGSRRQGRAAEAARAVGRLPAQRRLRHPAALRTQGRDHARDGVHRDPRRAAGRVRPRRGRARPRHHPGQHQPPRARADDHRPQLPGEDQRQHRQLGRDVVDRGGSREAALGDAVGRRHGDGSVDRQEHSRDARVDHPQLRGPDRHRADLPGARESRRPARGSDLGGLPRHARRAVRAGRGLLHRARRRAAPLHPDDRAPDDGHRVTRRLDPGEMVPRASPGELHVHALPRDLRDHARVRRLVLARRRPASRLDRRRQRRGAVRRAQDAGRADPDRLGVRRAGDERRARAMCRCTSSRRTWRSSSNGATRRRSTRWAR